MRLAVTKYTDHVTVHTVISTALGDLLIITDDEALLGLHWPGQRQRPHFAPPGAEIPDASLHPIARQTEREITEYLAGERQEFSVPVKTQGSAFEQDIWRRLSEIPYGQTVTYGELATELGNPRLAQRVGQAVGANPIGIIIPCHRVLGADGSLTGFAGGIERKRMLLELEEPEGGGANRLF